MGIAVAETDCGYQYVAVGEFGSCSGAVAGPNAETAVLDAIDAVLARFPDGDRIRFVVDLPGGSPLWRYIGQIAEAATDWWIERPNHADRSLIDAAGERLEHACPPPRPLVLGPLTVATDGSVRSRHAGLGWLACSGDFGLAGYRSSPDRVGTEPVLVAELCAIGDAIRGLPQRRLTVLSDSRRAVEMVDRWKRGVWIMPAGYPDEQPDREQNLHAVRRRIYRERNRIDVRWVAGHRGEPLNEGADALARLGSRYRRGDRDLDEDEYRRRAHGIAQAFAAEFRRVNDISA